VRGPLGAAILAQLHSNLIAENNLEDEHEHYKLQQAIIDELSGNT